jgi:hypothetical protein
MSVSDDRKPIFATGWGCADVATTAGTVITPEAQDAGLWAAAAAAQPFHSSTAAIFLIAAAG